MYRRNTNRHYLYPYLSLYMTISICKCTVDFCVFYNCKNSHQSGRGWCHIRIWTKFARNLGSAMTSRYSFNVHFQRQSGQWEAAVTTRAIRHAKLQWNNHHQQTNVQHFTGQMPFLSPNQQCLTMEGKSITFHPLSHPWSSNLVICHWRNWLRSRRLPSLSSNLRRQYPRTMIGKWIDERKRLQERSPKIITNDNMTVKYTTRISGHLLLCTVRHCLLWSF